ncbi:hypothetical protein JTB14_037929 [Gonioctena quinquepunctata]|nr:hypothetical protein JTB14_037929 [Gonioctena quinquepunctata]
MFKRFLGRLNESTMRMYSRYTNKVKNVNSLPIICAVGGTATVMIAVYKTKSSSTIEMRDEGNTVVKLTSREKRFVDFASMEYNGKIFMTPRDFLQSEIEAEPRYIMRRKILNQKELEEIKAATPTLKRGSSKLFRSLGEKGIISYTEYLFLLSILTKPQSGFKIAFNMMDKDGNGKVDKNEFLVMEKIISNVWESRREEAASIQEGYVDEGKGVQTHLVDTTLLVHFFGPKGNRNLNFDRFQKFMLYLQTEVLELEFNKFSRGLQTISEVDFAKILLRFTYLSTDDYDVYLQRLKDRIDTTKGITFEEFHVFFQFMNNFEDFIMAIKIYTIADIPISREEFHRSVNICIGKHLSQVSPSRSQTSTEFIEWIVNKIVSINIFGLKGGYNIGVFLHGGIQNIFKGILQLSAWTLAQFVNIIRLIGDLLHIEDLQKLPILKQITRIGNVISEKGIDIVFDQIGALGKFVDRIIYKHKDFFFPIFERALNLFLAVSNFIHQLESDGKLSDITALLGSVHLCTDHEKISKGSQSSEGFSPTHGGEVLDGDVSIGGGSGEYGGGSVENHGSGSESGSDDSSIPSKSGGPSSSASGDPQSSKNGGGWSTSSGLIGEHHESGKNVDKHYSLGSGGGSHDSEEEGAELSSSGLGGLPHGSGKEGGISSSGSKGGSRGLKNKGKKYSSSGSGGGSNISGKYHSKHLSSGSGSGSHDFEKEGAGLASSGLEGLPHGSGKKGALVAQGWKAAHVVQKRKAKFTLVRDQGVAHKGEVIKAQNREVVHMIQEEEGIYIPVQNQKWNPSTKFLALGQGEKNIPKEGSLRLLLDLVMEVFHCKIYWKVNQGKTLTSRYPNLDGKQMRS